MVTKVNHIKPTYPPDWRDIALQTKQAANWTCQLCSIKQGDDPHNNITVHHKDHDTFNNDPSNLLVVCQACHLRLEGIYRQHCHFNKTLALAFSLGQLILPSFEHLIHLQFNRLSYEAPTLQGDPAS